MRSSLDDNLGLYGEYNKTLRAWFVGFGFGVPAALIFKGGRTELLADPNHMCIVAAFLIGAGAQIFIAFLNKTISWCAYYREEKEQQTETAHPLPLWIASFENFFILDVVCDVVTMLSFGYSLCHIVRIFTSQPLIGG